MGGDAVVIAGSDGVDGIRGWWREGWREEGWREGGWRELGRLSSE